MMAAEAAKSIETDVTKTKIWKVGLFVIVIFFGFCMTGTCIHNLQLEKKSHSKVEQVAFEVYTKYSQKLDDIRGKN